MEMISRYFSKEEVIYSDTALRLGIDNSPDELVWKVVEQTAKHLDIVRQLLKQPIHVNSWYRCPKLNKAVGSLPTSQHIKGEAVDFICPKFGTPKEICKFIQDNYYTVEFDQLIFEHTWVHISFAVLAQKPRNQVLTLTSGGHYVEGLV